MKILSVKTVGSVILVILIMTTLFSRTIYSFNMPNVTAVLPDTARLNKKETAKGVVEWANVEYIYSVVSGKVEEILVSEGDYVYKDQPLIKLSFDIDALNDSLNKLETDKKKMLIDIENIDIRIENLNYNIIKLSEEEYTKDDVSYHELNKIKNEISGLESSLKNRQEYYSNQIALFESGIISKKELEDEQTELNNLKLNYENLIISMQSLEDSIQKEEIRASKDMHEKEESRERQIKAYRHEIELLNQDLKMYRLELEKNEQEKLIINRSLLEYTNNIFINSNSDGIVDLIDVNKGVYINKGELLGMIGVGNEFVIEAEISTDNNFVKVFDQPNLTNPLHLTSSIKGTVSKIIPDGNNKKVSINVKSDDVMVGETFDIVFENESSIQYTLIPNGAINIDSDGYFLYVIKQRNGILGKEFYTEKVRIYIGDSDNENTVITNGINFFEPIVHFSDKAFSEGESVKIKNEGDFFVD